MNADDIAAALSSLSSAPIELSIDSCNRPATSLLLQLATLCELLCRIGSQNADAVERFDLLSVLESLTERSTSEAGEILHQALVTYTLLGPHNAGAV